MAEEKKEEIAVIEKINSKKHIAGVSNMFIRGENLNGKENNRIVQKKI